MNDKWQRFKKYYYENKDLGFGLDISRMNFSDSFLTTMSKKMQDAIYDMEKLEDGAIANPDENRMVGHYWLRDSDLAPSAEIKNEINDTIKKINEFAAKVHSGSILSEDGNKFKYLLLIGIGGSALGPKFIDSALSTCENKMQIFFFDNTDPDGMEHVLNTIPNIAETLTLIVSKSGGTKETRNGQLIAKEAYKKAGKNFAKHFVAVTSVGSALDKTAVSEGWLARFPMWDWVGGRTSELSAVGLLPAALQGFNVNEMLSGAAQMDVATRSKEILNNPAAIMALMWYYIGDGKGEKDLVVLPYKDRLELLSRYLQQLIMESLGKEKDFEGNIVNQGLTVYGNKGSTDQHAFVQQLRDGAKNFFVTFIEVLKDKSSFAKNDYPFSLNVEEGVVSGDYLSGFYQGTRQALYESGRESITITIDEVNAKNVGALIALFERTVGLYASLININAYHQPGVEAGKKAAGEILSLQLEVVGLLVANEKELTIEEIAAKLNREKDVEAIYKILRKLAANNQVKVMSQDDIFGAKYYC